MARKFSEEERSKQRRIRIKLAVAAYAYEFENTSVMTDAEFDALCLEVDLAVPTDNRKLDNYFRKRFDPSTGVWVRMHPERHKLKYLLDTYYK